MKRYTIQSGARLAEEAEDGFWVRYEDAEAELFKERLRATRAEADATALREQLARVRVSWANDGTALQHERDMRAMAEDLRAQAQAAAQRSHAELEALRACVTRAVTVLATPGTWSEFARVALKELRGG